MTEKHQNTIDEAVDFLPDALAIRHARIPFWARSGILWIATIFCAAVMWASLSFVDVIVISKGKVVSDHPTIVMRPLELNVITDICVREGDRVKAGQPLIKFESTFNVSDKERHASEVRLHSTKLARLTAEIENRDYVIGEKPTKEEVLQKKQFDNRQTYFKERCKYFEYEVVRLQKLKQSMMDNSVWLKRKLGQVRDIEKMYEESYKMKAISQQIFKSQKVDRFQLQREVSDLLNEIQIKDSEILSKQAEYASFVSDWNATISNELTSTRENLIASRKEYDKYERREQYSQLVAPEDAVVHEIVHFAKGSGVQEAETVISLVPLGGQLEAEVEVRADDIGKIRVGDSVRVKVSAFPFQQHGTINGTVKFISEDSFRKGNDSSQAFAMESSFYKVRVQLHEAETPNSNLMKRLIPGMEVQGEIRVEERRVIQYLTNPIIKSLSESIREP